MRVSAAGKRVGSHPQKRALVSSKAAKKTVGAHSETLYLLSHPALEATIANFFFLSATNEQGCGAFFRVFNRQEL